MPRIAKPKLHLIEKRDEIIWALSFQDYNHQDIATMFGLDRSSIKRVVNKMPKNWRPKWQKIH